MKLHYFIKDNQITGWAYGNNEFDVDGTEKKTVELSNEDSSKIVAKTHQPYLEKGELKLGKTPKSLEIESRKALKDKFKKGEATQEDINKLAEILL